MCLILTVGRLGDYVYTLKTDKCEIIIFKSEGFIYSGRFLIDNPLDVSAPDKYELATAWGSTPEATLDKLLQNVAVYIGDIEDFIYDVNTNILKN